MPDSLLKFRFYPSNPDGFSDFSRFIIDIILVPYLGLELWSPFIETIDFLCAILDGYSDHFSVQNLLMRLSSRHFLGTTHDFPHNSSFFPFYKDDDGVLILAVRVMTRFTNRDLNLSSMQNLVQCSVVSFVLCSKRLHRD